MTDEQAQPDGSQSDSGSGGSDAEPAVSDPAEVIRLVSMFQALMVEVRDITLDEAGRKRLLDIHRNALDALRDLLSDELEDELEQLGLPIENADASESELRVAQAQLVGWLNGLFQGIQAALVAQQMDSAQQLQQLQEQRPALKEGHPGGQYL